MTIPAPALSALTLAALDRRTLIRGALIGSGMLAGGLLMAGPAFATVCGSGFTHGVASGEPGQDRVLLWSRFESSGEAAKLGFEVSETIDFTRVVARGEALARAQSDWCAKAFATGLEPGRWYYYRFVGPAGEVSPVGRTRTLPAGGVDPFRMAVFSCSNIGFGYFNAYAHAANDGRFDLALHLGDYYYEYERGEYPSAKETAPGRVVMPANETVSLADYRLRHATYRQDPDLQRLFQLMPVVMMWDDHETANDSWKGGAENHQSDKEGDWQVRKAAAVRAYREWLPVSDEDWASYDIGDLATLWRLESRLTARDRQLDLGKALAGAQPGTFDQALAAFRDGAWKDPSRHLLGETQQAWLAAGLAASVRSGKPWQVIAQQVVMGSLELPEAVLSGLAKDAPDYARKQIAAGVMAGKAGVPYNMDSWDGYPAARDRLLASAEDAGANLVVLSGDSHNAWAFDLDRAGRAVGVEFGGHSVTSPGAEDYLPWMKSDALANALVARNPQLQWCDTARRGYMAVELTAQAATNEWRFTDSVLARSGGLAATQRMRVLPGRRKLVAA